MNWLPVVGYEGLYEVSDTGLVRGLKRGKVKAQSPNKDNGYLYVNLCKAGVQKSLKVSAMVAEAFIGPRPTGYDVCHNDNDKYNNAATNLRWDTRSNNIKDQIRHGTHNRYAPDGSVKTNATNTAKDRV